jgi:hypothetical protein
MRGTEFHAEAASLAALNDDRNASFWHLIPQLKSDDLTITPGNSVGRDYAWNHIQNGVMAVTKQSEEEHQAVFPSYSS